MFQKTERAAAIFFPKKPDRKSNLFRSFGPFWPHNFEPIFGSVLGGQNEGPGGGAGVSPKPCKFDPFGTQIHHCLKIELRTVYEGGLREPLPVPGQEMTIFK